MSDDRLPPVEDLLDLSFPSLALQHMDLKQWELDTAAAKVDELSLQLQRLWSDGPPRPPPTRWGRPHDLALRRRPPPKGWNESDLDVTYEKRGGGHERGAEGHRVGLQPWRESALDGGKVGLPHK
eukprot:XP_024997595.1 LOW QUALITY PROTEIN: relA-associated inhibitor-like [Gallus gallus]